MAYQPRIDATIRGASCESSGDSLPPRGIPQNVKAVLDDIFSLSEGQQGDDLEVDRLEVVTPEKKDTPKESSSASMREELRKPRNDWKAGTGTAPAMFPSPTYGFERPLVRLYTAAEHYTLSKESTARPLHSQCCLPFKE